MCNDSELVIREPSTIEFNCSYDASANTTVVYTWYLDDAVQPGTSPSASIAISSGTHVVKCRAQVNKSPDCMCDDFRTLTVTVVGKQCRIFIPHICVLLMVGMFIYYLFMYLFIYVFIYLFIYYRQVPPSGNLPVLFLLSSQKSTFCPQAECGKTMN